MRIPAYTDRVLWMPPPPGCAAGAPVPPPAGGGGEGVSESRERATPERPVVLLRYDSVRCICTSDHKPVVAEFEVAYDDGASNPTWQTSIRASHGLARQGTGLSSGLRLMDSAHGPGGAPASGSARSAGSAFCAVM